MKNIAIKGHPTRGKEVIEILEMLGGINTQNLYGDENYAYYTIDSDKEIKAGIYVFGDEELSSFTLEKFLEKFPYKVGDKVQHKGAISCGYIFEVEKMRWEEDTVKYTLRLLVCNYKTSTIPAEYLQPYKEETMDKAVFDANAQCCDIMNRLIKKETMEEQKKDYEEWFQINYLEFENNDDTWADEVEVNLGKDYEIQIRGDKTFIVKKQLQLPKTYAECCDIFSISPYYNLKYYTNEYGYHDYTKINKLCSLRDKLNTLSKLLICRDAYWKIAGEKMGLGKQWEPDWLDTNTQKYCIYYVGDEIKKQPMLEVHHFLAFPTAKMCDMFFENFKDLIEQCKDFL